jgi:hypothetical protein
MTTSSESARSHRPRSHTVFGAALVAGAAVAFGLNSALDAHLAQVQPRVESEPILVAIRSLQAGAPVTVWDVALRDWPKAMVPSSAMRLGDSLENLVVRHPLREGQPILAVQLARADASPDQSATPLPVATIPTSPVREPERDLWDQDPVTPRATVATTSQPPLSLPSPVPPAVAAAPASAVAVTVPPVTTPPVSVPPASPLVVADTPSGAAADAKAPEQVTATASRMDDPPARVALAPAAPLSTRSSAGRSGATTTRPNPSSLQFNAVPDRNALKAAIAASEPNEVPPQAVEPAPLPVAPQPGEMPRLATQKESTTNATRPRPTQELANQNNNRAQSARQPPTRSGRGGSGFTKGYRPN